MDIWRSIREVADHAWHALPHDAIQLVRHTESGQLYIIVTHNVTVLGIAGPLSFAVVSAEAGDVILRGAPLDLSPDALSWTQSQRWETLYSESVPNGESQPE
jgi:hypothetical protein